MKYQESQPSSKEPTSSSTAESQERKERQPQARNHPKYDGWCKGHHKSKNVDKIRILHRGEEIENCTSRPFRRMELGSSSRRDLPPRNPKKILLQRRCTEPLPMAARKACMQDLGYFEDGRKTVLLKRFLPLPTPPFDRVAASSDQSCSSMPLRMPVRKASMEEVRLGCSSRCSQAPQKPMNTTTTRWC
ncbi:unnamed protein product [Cylindrotheca closterium]|uniref:Uncharacterized protein n=1 Tax=Cylindrotheca closterium TaxID=2856 RepID=A0AAD2GBF8_9STRA|nr:unnamed protein product [Cylindrotheca closterium]